MLPHRPQYRTESAKETRPIGDPEMRERTGFIESNKKPGLMRESTGFLRNYKGTQKAMSIFLNLG